LPILVEERLHFGDEAGPRRPVGQVGRRGGSAAEQCVLGLSIGPAGGGAELRDPPAVGVDQGDIDVVLRRAAHQADRQNRSHSRSFGGRLI
jgi:hypothetical protein